MATIIEVAKRAQVSTATVSNVIRGTRKVSEELSDRVNSAIRELNYSPNEIARSLKVKQTRMLAMVLPDITNPFFPDMIRGAEDTAFERGYFLLTANTNEQTSRERRIVAALRAYRVDGILLASSEDARGHDAKHIAEAISAGISVVCLDRTVPDVNSDAVLLDNIGGARDCVRHLIERGHRRIGIITGSLHLQTGYERLLGYKRALSRAGIPIDKHLIAEGDFRFESGQQRAEELLKLKPRPSAIFTCNGLMAAGALASFERLGVRYPEDVALATFDDITLDPSFHAHLTAVIQPSYEMGRNAASILIDRIEGKLGEDPVLMRVRPTLVLRDSTSRKMKEQRPRSKTGR
jgi:LacI family transcriptional regulator